MLRSPRNGMERNRKRPWKIWKSGNMSKVGCLRHHHGIGTLEKKTWWRRRDQHWGRRRDKRKRSWRIVIHSGIYPQDYIDKGPKVEFSPISLSSTLCHQSDRVRTSMHWSSMSNLRSPLPWVNGILRASRAVH